MRISDEILIAYVDDELDEPARAEVEQAARTDAALARRIQAHRRLRARIEPIFGDLISEAPPERLLTAAGGGSRGPAPVIDLAQARAKVQAERAAKAPRKSAPPWMIWAGVAACMLIVAGGAYQMAPQPGSGPDAGGASPGALMAPRAVATALDGQLAADPAQPGQLVRVGLSFRSQDGHDCRTFAVQAKPGFSGLACREAQGWRLRMAVADAGPAPGAGGGGYRTAASDTPAPILDAVQGLIAGAPFDARQEAEARAHAWRP